MHIKQHIIQLTLSLGVVIIIGIISSMVYAKFDLTEEKRHTLTSSTSDLLENLDDYVYVKCYLSGEFPASFKRLEKAIKERMDEFRDLSDGMLDYEFIDPYATADEKSAGEMEKALYEQGLRFTRLNYEEDGVKKYKTIWPGAIITYQDKDYPIQFFKSENPEPSDAMVNASVNNLEYEFTGKLRYLMNDTQPRIAILEGHGELEDIEMADFTAGLLEQYFVERVKINEQINALSTKLEDMRYRTNEFELLIIAKPDSIFSNKDKLVIDQFIMNGGKVLWMIDPILTDLDSLRVKQQTMGLTNEMGLYDMLFDYGVRLNRDMVIDYQSSPIVFDTGPMGNQRNMQMFNWYYAPIVLANDTAHPILSNLDPILVEFASSLDTVGEHSGIEKTPLLRSSQLSKILKAPIRVHPGIVDLGVEYFSANPQPNQMMGVLLEGSFNSNFAFRLPDTLQTDPNFAFRDKSVPSKMIVIADGDIARNKVMNGQEGPVPVPLGYDRYAGKVVYDNKEFLLNAVNYLLDDDAMISIRSRTIKLRKLDETQIVHKKSRWQIINVVFPLFLVLVAGIIQWYWRKRKYQRKKSKN